MDDSKTPRTAPYGSWRSPITIDALVAGGVGLSEVRAAAAGVFWIEGRPQDTSSTTKTNACTDSRSARPPNRSRPSRNGHAACGTPTCA